ncbi:hypothetical protein B382_22430 [Stutzerimonas stutzeri B1SMN1]|nr:hypothetical protein B382_22430 [Stutzerimonas stutzeri B1SMN1]
MKSSLALMLLIISSVVQAMDNTYGIPNGQFPDELSKQGLPVAFPCYENNGTLVCVWMLADRKLEWVDENGIRRWAMNRAIGNCVRGTCQSNGKQLGFYNGEATRFVISTWYYVDTSTEGQPVAYLWDTGPGFGGDRIAYPESAEMLYDFYIRSNLTESRALKMTGGHYNGGLEQYKLDSQKHHGAEETPSVKDNFSEIKEAWCNPRMDDECFVNGQKVTKNEIKRLLPKVDFDEVMSNGGVCEFPICYDYTGKPIGVR